MRCDYCSGTGWMIHGTRCPVCSGRGVVEQRVCRPVAQNPKAAEPKPKEQTLGQEIIDSLQEFLDDVRAGKPVEQTIMRRMTVNGKTIYVDETFKAPLRSGHG